IMSVRSNWPMFSALMRKYACSGMSTWTPGGMYTNEPPDQTAELSAANLLSSGGMMVPKYSRTRSSCSRRPLSMSRKTTPLLFFFSSRRRHTRYWRDWSSDVCSSDLVDQGQRVRFRVRLHDDEGAVG